VKKKVAQALLVCMATLVLFLCAYYEKTKQVYDRIETERTKTSARIGNSDEETLGNYLNLIPSNIVLLLQDHEWGFCLVSEDEMNEISKRYGYTDRLIGLSVYSERLIYVSNKRIDSVLHEVWHAVDSILGDLSEQKEAESIYRAEVKAFLKAYPETNELNAADASEYFAEAFQQYILSEETLKESCPKTYDYLRDILYALNN